jgi:hypothetical protein
MKLNLPSYQRLPGDLVDRFKRQLRRSNVLIKGCQLAVGAILPIGEAILTNLATGSQGNSRPFWLALAVAGMIHLFLLVTLLLVEMPLPQFLVEYDEQAARLEEALAKVEAYKSYATTFIESVAATQLSLLEIEQMKSQPREKLEDVVDQVLRPWIDRRTAIFSFDSGESLYNFAVYGEKADEFVLCYRKCDDRLVRHDRTWRKGDGHVGTCGLQGRTVFLHLPESGDSSAMQETSQPRDEDRKYYNSMVATPIRRGGLVSGVFIVTSSKHRQFVKELHSPIVEVIGLLLTQAISDCWRKEV